MYPKQWSPEVDKQTEYRCLYNVFFFTDGVLGVLLCYSVSSVKIFSAHAHKRHNYKRTHEGAAYVISGVGSDYFLELRLSFSVCVCLDLALQA